jgi:hypothetical protein
MYVVRLPSYFGRHSRLLCTWRNSTLNKVLIWTIKMEAAPVLVNVHPINEKLYLRNETVIINIGAEQQDWQDH